MMDARVIACIARRLARKDLRAFCAFGCTCRDAWLECSGVDHLRVCLTPAAMTSDFVRWFHASAERVTSVSAHRTVLAWHSMAWLRDFRRLDALRMVFCRVPSRIASRLPPSLATLVLHQLVPPPAPVPEHVFPLRKALGHLEALRHLSVTFAPGWTLAIADLSPFTQLTHLELRRVEALAVTSPILLGQGGALKLHALDIMSFPRTGMSLGSPTSVELRCDDLTFDDDMLRVLGTGACTSMQRLELTCPGILRLDASNFPCSLTSLCLSGGMCVVPDTARHCPMLREARYHGRASLAVTAASSVGEACEVWSGVSDGTPVDLYEVSSIVREEYEHGGEEGHHGAGDAPPGQLVP